LTTLVGASDRFQGWLSGRRFPIAGILNSYETTFIDFMVVWSGEAFKFLMVVCSGDAFRFRMVVWSGEAFKFRMVVLSGLALAYTPLLAVAILAAATGLGDLGDCVDFEVDLEEPLFAIRDFFVIAI